MSRTDDPRDPRNRPGAADEEDIEILEVVGLDEDEIIVEVEEDEDEAEAGFDAGVPEVGPAQGEDGLDDATSREVSMLRERLLRLTAEIDNLNKRFEREKAEHYRTACAALVTRLLPVLDNFERALSVPDGADPGSFRRGMELIHRQLREVLEREGLRRIEAEGGAFDPTVHEAVATDASGTHEPHRVVQVLQEGYFLNDRMLRPAAVKVSVEPGEAGGPGAGADEEPA